MHESIAEALGGLRALAESDTSLALPFTPERARSVEVLLDALHDHLQGAFKVLGDATEMLEEMVWQAEDHREDTAQAADLTSRLQKAESDEQGDLRAQLADVNRDVRHAEATYNRAADRLLDRIDDLIHLLRVAPHD